MDPCLFKIDFEQDACHHKIISWSPVNRCRLRRWPQWQPGKLERRIKLSLISTAELFLRLSPSQLRSSSKQSIIPPSYFQGVNHEKLRGSPSDWVSPVYSRVNCFFSWGQWVSLLFRGVEQCPWTGKWVQLIPLPKDAHHNWQDEQSLISLSEDIASYPRFYQKGLKFQRTCSTCFLSLLLNHWGDYRNWRPFETNTIRINLLRVSWEYLWKFFWRDYPNESSKQFDKGNRDLFAKVQENTRCLWKFYWGYKKQDESYKGPF